jgi:lysophospholipase L1-like esterase
MTTTPARVLRAIVTVGIAGLLAVLLRPVPAQAVVTEYVALGDSYSSGTGTGTYLADGSDCLRSAYAYPSLIAAAGGYALNFRACSGATIPDVTAAQVAALTPTTGLVSISVGGNDAGFADVLTECAQPGWMSDCDEAIDGAQAIINGPLPGSLSALYADIRTRAPSARVVVVGYPRIFNGEDCNAATWFSPSEEARLNQTADLLNSRLAALAAAAGFGFADPTSRFVGHAVCDDPEWINGLSWPIVESYHPNVDGQAQGYTPTVSPVLTGTAMAATAAVRRDARDQAWSLATQQREYAELDRTIEPKRLVKPDLTTKAAKVAARKAGIDLERWIDRHS